MRTIIYPGSFDPITNGHLEIAIEALKSFDKVIILVANNPNKNERFTIADRYEMVKEAVKDIKGIEVSFTTGLTVDFAKRTGTHYLLRGIRDDADLAYENKYAELTHQIDRTIEFIYIKAPRKYINLSSSKIDEMARLKQDISQFVPESVVSMYKKR